MNDFQFEQSQWEAYLCTLKTGSTIPAALLLTMLEGEDDETVEDAFDEITNRRMHVDLQSLPKPSSLGQAAVRLNQEEEFVKNGLQISSMDETDTLRVYLEEIAANPCTGDEEILAAQNANGEYNHTQLLTNLGLSRVIQMAKKHVGYGVLLLDLIQEGSIGLWQGIQSFSSGEYIAHIEYFIQISLEKAVFLQARNNGIGQKLRQSLLDYRSADERLLIELGRNPSLEEIADAIHLNLDEAQIIQKMMDNAILLDQANKLGKIDEHTEEENLAIEDTAYFQMRQRISELLSQLSERDAQILTLRYGLERGLPMSPEETGKKLGINATEVVSREAAALAMLRGN